MLVQRIHHVAYRCMDSAATANFYKRVLGMELIGAAAEELVPSTKERDPYMNIFLDAGDGDILAFFEVTNWPPMRPDPDTPAWIQHIAFQVESLDALAEAKARVEAEGQEVIGPVDHVLFQSIYFHDPNGHRLELAAWTRDPSEISRLGVTADQMLAEWTRKKRPPRTAAWLHEDEFRRAGT